MNVVDVEQSQVIRQDTLTPPQTHCNQIITFNYRDCVTTFMLDSEYIKIHAHRKSKFLPYGLDMFERIIILDLSNLTLDKREDIDIFGK